MPKLPPAKLLQGPIAARTRSKMGSRIYKRLPTQYPVDWFFGGTRKSSETEHQQPPSEHSLVDERRPLVPGRTTTDDDDPSNPSGVANRNVNKFGMDNDLFRFARSKSKRQKDAKSTKRLKGSLIELVKIMPRKRSSGKNVSSNSKARKGRILKSKRNRNSRSKSKKASMKRYRSKVTRRRERQGTTKSKRRGRRMKSRKQKTGRRKKTCKCKGRKGKKARATRRPPKKRRRTRRRRDSDSADSCGHRRAAVTVGPSVSKERQRELQPPASIFIESVDKGHDEIKEDPLNEIDICRSIVKSIHGIPADDREPVKNANDPGRQGTTRRKGKRPAKRGRSRLRRDRNKNNGKHRLKRKGRHRSSRRKARGHRGKSPRIIRRTGRRNGLIQSGYQHIHRLVKKVGRNRRTKTAHSRSNRRKTRRFDKLKEMRNHSRHRVPAKSQGGRHYSQSPLPDDGLAIVEQRDRRLSNHSASSHGHRRNFIRKTGTQFRHKRRTGKFRDSNNNSSAVTRPASRKCKEGRACRRLCWWRGERRLRRVEHHRTELGFLVSTYERLRPELTKPRHDNCSLFNRTNGLR